MDCKSSRLCRCAHLNIATGFHHELRGRMTTLTALIATRLAFIWLENHRQHAQASISSDCCPLCAWVQRHPLVCDSASFQPMASSKKAFSSTRAETADDVRSLIAYGLSRRDLAVTVLLQISPASRSASLTSPPASLTILRCAL